MFLHFQFLLFQKLLSPKKSFSFSFLNKFQQLSKFDLKNNNKLNRFVNNVNVFSKRETV
jgi:hypothetical protein